jgi:hypothetical protein
VKALPKKKKVSLNNLIAAGERIFTSYLLTSFASAAAVRALAIAISAMHTSFLSTSGCLLQESLPKDSTISTISEVTPLLRR